MSPKLHHCGSHNLRQQSVHRQCHCYCRHTLYYSFIEACPSVSMWPMAMCEAKQFIFISIWPWPWHPMKEWQRMPLSEKNGKVQIVCHKFHQTREKMKYYKTKKKKKKAINHNFSTYSLQKHVVSILQVQCYKLMLCFCIAMICDKKKNFHNDLE